MGLQKNASMTNFNIIFAQYYGVAVTLNTYPRVGSIS
jgi:hypothetical protein